MAHFVRLQIDAWRHGCADRLPAEYFSDALLQEQRRFWDRRFDNHKPVPLLAVARRGAEVAGVVCAFRALDHGGEACLEHLYVDRAHQRSGVGRELVAYAAAWCAAGGTSASLVFSVVEGSTAAFGFCRKLGGTLSGAGFWSPPFASEIACVEFGWSDMDELQRLALPTAADDR